MYEITSNDTVWEYGCKDLRASTKATSKKSKKKRSKKKVPSDEKHKTILPWVWKYARNLHARAKENAAAAKREAARRRTR